MFRITPLWQIQKRQENDMLRAALGPAVGNAVIAVHKTSKGAVRGSDSLMVCSVSGEKLPHYSMVMWDKSDVAVYGGGGHGLKEGDFLSKECQTEITDKFWAKVKGR